MLYDGDIRCTSILKEAYCKLSKSIQLIVSVLRHLRASGVVLTFSGVILFGIEIQKVDIQVHT